jgi:heme a synthase
MSTKENNIVTRWLLVVCGLIIFMVAFGGLVRLTRSGLSIVEWNPISGIIPPIGEDAWQEEFAKYRATPEYQKVNAGMTLTEYKEIFYLEFIHRLVARIAGLIVALPLLYFLIKGIIPWRKSGLYVAIGLLFAFQGYLGWYMVSSGLVDRPSVSHYRLTIHLLTALLLLGLTFWAALNHRHQFPRFIRPALKSRSFGLAAGLMLVLIIQISWGGLVAGLKAGYASNTWPLMAGRLVPEGLLSYMEPWWRNLVAYAVTVHFVHRWFALLVLLFSGLLYLVNRRQEQPAALNRGIVTMFVLTTVQIILGISVVWFSVPIALALTHQVTALLLFLTTIYINYHVLHTRAAEPALARAPVATTAA